MKIRHYPKDPRELILLCGSLSKRPDLTMHRKFVTCKRCLKVLKKQNYMPEV